MREAILHLSDTQLANVGLDDIVAAARDAGLQDVTELVCHGAGGVILLQVATPIPDDELTEFESVEWWDQLAATTAGVTYLCKISPPELATEVSLDDHGLTHDVSAVREDGVDVSVVGSQAEISRSAAAVDEAGMTPLLQQLTDYQGASSAMAALTERQQEVVRTAYAMGYYDVPRQASADDVAADLGLDGSTVTEHLQRAERNLLSQILEG